MSAPCLIRDALIVPSTDSGGAPHYGWMEVRDGRIVGVGRSGRGGAYAGRVIDGQGHALIPGLINTHAHSHSSLTRGSAEGLALEDWIAVIEREQAHLTEDQAYHGALITYAEALLSGTTSIVDMCLHPRAALDAARKIGIRAVIAPYAADGKPFTPDLAQTERLIESARGDPRNQVWVGLHDLESCSDEQIRAGAALAARHAVGIHLHCSETRRSVEATHARTGRTPVSHLAELGALGHRTLLAHGVWVSQTDRTLLASAGAHLAHCPQANLKLGSGIAPMPALCAAGVNVTLATDGAKANNSLDMFDVMKFASLMHKGIAEDPKVLPPAQVLAMATRHGAAALGTNTARLEPGAAADLALVRLDGCHLQACVPETIITNLVHAARGSDVALVMVDGHIVVQEGRVIMDEWQNVRDRSKAAARELMTAAAGGASRMQEETAGPRRPSRAT